RARGSACTVSYALATTCGRYKGIPARLRVLRVHGAGDPYKARRSARLRGTKVTLGTCSPCTEEENNVEETSSGNCRCRPSDVHGQCRVLHRPRASDEEMQGRRNS